MSAGGGGGWEGRSLYEDSTRAFYKGSTCKVSMRVL